MRLHTLLSWFLLLSAFDGFCSETNRFQAGAFTFQKPEHWELIQPKSPMRKAQLKITGANDAEFAEVVFFHFGEGQGGGAHANVSRWLSQFKEPKEQLNSKIEEKEVSGRKLTLVYAEGTYNSGMPGGPTSPMENFALQGAILPEGDGDVFVRMTGPREFVKKLVPEFTQMVEMAMKERYEK